MTRHPNNPPSDAYVVYYERPFLILGLWSGSKGPLPFHSFAQQSGLKCFIQNIFTDILTFFLCLLQPQEMKLKWMAFLILHLTNWPLYHDPFICPQICFRMITLLWISQLYSNFTTVSLITQGIKDFRLFLFWKGLWVKVTAQGWTKHVSRRWRLRSQSLNWY